MDENYRKLLKNRSKTSEAAENARIKLGETLNELFDISSADAESKILTDRLRTKTAKEEDQRFLVDQRGPRKMEIGGEDCRFVKKLDNKLKRIAAANDRIIKSKEICSTSSCSNTTTLEQPDAANCEKSDESDVGDCSDNDPEFVHDLKTKKKKRLPNTVSLEIPRDILKQTALTGLRYKQSYRERCMMWANVVNASGGDIDQFHCSTTSVHRYNKRWLEKLLSL